MCMPAPKDFFRSPFTPRHTPKPPTWTLRSMSNNLCRLLQRSPSLETVPTRCSPHATAFATTPLTPWGPPSLQVVATGPGESPGGRRGGECRRENTRHSEPRVASLFALRFCKRHTRVYHSSNAHARFPHARACPSACTSRQGVTRH